MRRLWPILLNFLFISTTCVAQSPNHQTNLTFITPSSIDSTEYFVGEEIGIRWTSPFSLTTLEVWQGPHEDGSFAMQTLIANATHDISMHTWSAHTIFSKSLTIPLHFRLQKGNQPNLCAGCYTSSTNLTLLPRTNLADVGSNSDSTFGEGGGDLTKAGAVGVGVGIGVGALAIALFIGLLLCIDKQHWRSKKQKRRREREKRKQRHPLDSSTVKSRTTDRGARRELNLWHERQWQRERELRRQRVYSSWAESVATSASGRPKSYIEPFEFEDLDGTIRDGWYELLADGKWKPAPKEKWQEAHVNEKSADQSSFASGSTRVARVPEGYEQTEDQLRRYEAAEREVGIVRPQRSLRLSRF